MSTEGNEGTVDGSERVKGRVLLLGFTFASLCATKRWLARGDFLLGAKGFLVALQRLAKAFQLVENPAFVEISQGHRFIDGDGLIVAFNRIFQALQLFQGSAFLDERFCIVWVDCQRLIEGRDGILRLIEMQERLAFAEKQSDFGIVVSFRVSVGTGVVARYCPAA